VVTICDYLEIADCDFRMDAELVTICDLERLEVVAKCDHLG